MKKLVPSTTRYIILWIIGFVICIAQNVPSIKPAYFTTGITVIVSLVIAVAIFEQEFIGALYGLTLGVFLDSSSNGKFAFCALTLMVIGCICGLLAKHLLNASFFCGLILSLLGCFVFFSLHWFFFYVLKGLENPIYYFVNYSLKSILISFLFIIPFYFLVKLIHVKTFKGR